MGADANTKLLCASLGVSRKQIFDCLKYKDKPLIGVALTKHAIVFSFSFFLSVYFVFPSVEKVHIKIDGAAWIEDSCLFIVCAVGLFPAQKSETVGILIHKKWNILNFLHFNSHAQVFQTREKCRSLFRFKDKANISLILSLVKFNLSIWKERERTWAKQKKIRLQFALDLIRCGVGAKNFLFKNARLNWELIKADWARDRLKFKRGRWCQAIVKIEANSNVIHTYIKKESKVSLKKLSTWCLRKKIQRISGTWLLNSKLAKYQQTQWNIY